MRTTLSTAAAVVLTATFASAQTGTGQTPTGQTPTGQVGTTGAAAAADEEAIRQIGEQYAAAWNSGNASQAASIFTEDGSFTDVTGQTHKGRSAIERDLTQDKIGPATGMKLSVQTDSIRFVQPDLAVATGTTRFTATGDTTQGGAGHYMSVLRKVGGEWKVAAVHAGINPPPGFTMPGAAAQPTGTTGTAGSASAAGAAADEEAIRDLGHKWEEAAKNRDVETLGRIYHDDFTEIDPAGAMRNKEEALAEVRSGSMTFESFVPSNVETRLYGNMAVVTGTSDVKATHKGQDVSGKYRWTDTYVKQNGEWKVVASQITRVMEEPEQK